MKTASLILLSLAVASPVRAQERNIAQARANKKAPDSSDGELKQSLGLLKAKNYKAATQKLFQLATSPRFADKRPQIKYLLGLGLYDLKLYQTAAFQFVDVARSGQTRHLKQSLEKLSLAADKLENDTLLNYAISRVKISDFPATHRDMLYYRIGEFKLKSKLFAEAAQNFANVKPESPYYAKSRYMQALAYAESKEPEKALQVLDPMLSRLSSTNVTDSNRVALQMAKARALYQKKDWDASLEAYREVPRDTLFWHDALFESSWAMLRAARFRSALSNFHSLHSTYYEDFYLPESLLLRSIVYLYICKYDEMQKTLDSFEQLYAPMHRRIISFLKTNNDPAAYYGEVEKVAQMIGTYKQGKKRPESQLPFQVVRKIMGQADFERNFGYVKKLDQEQARILALGGGWRNSSIGRYAQKIVTTRQQNARKTLGRIVRNHLIAMQTEIRDLMEQNGFLRYEMLSGRKTEIKKRIAGKDLGEKQLDSDSSRSFYIQNGYEYWPFQGEYWLDEIGNYHYVGVQSCE